MIPGERGFHGQSPSLESCSSLSGHFMSLSFSFLFSLSLILSPPFFFSSSLPSHLPPLGKEAAGLCISHGLCRKQFMLFNFFFIIWKENAFSRLVLVEHSIISIITDIYHKISLTEILPGPGLILGSKSSTLSNDWASFRPLGITFNVPAKAKNGSE